MDPLRWPERLQVADDLWVIAHSDRTVRLNPVALGLGLAGALLGELVLSGHLVIRGGTVSVRDETPPGDAASHVVLEQVLAEPRHDVRRWVRFLATSAEQTVVGRLLRAGLVEPVQQRRRLVHTTLVHRPVDSNQAYWRSLRLKNALAGKYGQREWPDVFLAGLIDAAGFLPAVLREDHAAGHAYLQHWLPYSDPPALTELVDAVATLAGDAVLGARLKP